MELSGRSVLVTGGGRGLGRAIAERLAGDVARVGVLARTAAELEQTVEAIQDFGGESAAFPADVLDPTALGKAVARFRSWAGRLDDLVCAAGQLKAVGPLATVDPDLWWRDLETAVRGFHLCVREALPLLREASGGSITVLVGPGHNADLPYATGYGAAQVALVRLVESLGRELAAEGVSVFALNPGLVVTGLVRPWLDSPEGRHWLPQFTEALAEGKEVGPEVVAEMAGWLIARRPGELRGRVVAAALVPEVLETRLGRIQAENLQVLRLR
jgi:NAD(P)-dependent dehydrogenase (short-subunit alcohol dehydrogenase family)